MRFNDTRLVNQTSGSSSGECTSGETEEVKLVAGDIVVDDEVAGFDNVLEEAATGSTCKKDIASKRWLFQNRWEQAIT